MATAFEPSSSISALRPPHFATDAPSMADSLPTIHFGFEDLRERMARFTTRFDDFIEKGRKRVLEERNQFRMSLAELKDDERHHELSLQATQHAQSMHTQTLAKERVESTELHSAISDLTAHKEELLQQRTTLQAELSTIQATLAARKDAQAKHGRYLAEQSRFNGPELAFWEERLGMRIELGQCPVKGRQQTTSSAVNVEDQIRFTYTCVTDQDWNHEGWVELDVSCRDYKIVGTEPKLEEDEIREILQHLNEGRDLVPFLTEIRTLIVKALK